MSIPLPLRAAGYNLGTRSNIFAVAFVLDPESSQIAERSRRAARLRQDRMEVRVALHHLPLFIVRGVVAQRKGEQLPDMGLDGAFPIRERQSLRPAAYAEPGRV